MRNESLRRKEKAELLVKYVTITSDQTAIIQSQSSDKVYHINYKEGTCECPDSYYRSIYCKHLQAVDLKLVRTHENTWGKSDNLIRKDLLLL